MAGSVHGEREGRIGWIVFDHPERRNALSANMWGELAEVAESFASDDSVRVMVMRGAGELAFVSGADISQFEGTEGSETSRNLAMGGGSAFHRLVTARKPVLAMIHGFCIGGGVAVSLAADMRYAAEDATFAIPAARLGVGYDFGGIDVLAQLVGLSNAKEILFSARRYDAREALSMGLVNRVLPKAALEEHVRELADRMARNAPLTVRAVKISAHELGKPHSQRRYDEAAAAIRDCFESRDFEEGVKAFMEKRDPEFEGR